MSELTHTFSLAQTLSLNAALICPIKFHPWMLYRALQRENAADFYAPWPGDQVVFVNRNIQLVNLLLRCYGLMIGNQNFRCTYYFVNGAKPCTQKIHPWRYETQSGRAPIKCLAKLYCYTFNI